jgi:hypothetical protein
MEQDRQRQRAAHAMVRVRDMAKMVKDRDKEAAEKKGTAVRIKGKTNR